MGAIPCGALLTIFTLAVSAAKQGWKLSGLWMQAKTQRIAPASVPRVFASDFRLFSRLGRDGLDPHHLLLHLPLAGGAQVLEEAVHQVLVEAVRLGEEHVLEEGF